MRIKLFSFCLMLVLLFGFFSDLWAANNDLPSLPKLNWMMNGQLITKPTNALTPLGAGTGAISGRVTKASGSDPIPNVVVTARQIDCPYRSYADTTGSDGYYIIDDVPCGMYSVRTGIDSIYVDLYWNNKYLWETPDPVAVSNNTTENINFSLRLGGKITGSVTLSGSFFVLLTFVFAIDTTHGTVYYDMPVGLGSTASYSIEGLPTGDYKLRTFNLLGFIDTYYNNKSSWVTADLVSAVEGGTTSSKNFTLNQGGKIEGNVSSVVSGPLDSALVLGILLADTLEWFQVAFTNASGNYSLSGLRSGYWKVFALGDTANAFEFYNDKDNWTSADSILVTSPSTVTGKNFSLESGGSISGHVFDSEGNIISNTTVAAYESSLVQLLLQEGIPLLSQVGISFRQSTTSGDGGYRITGLRTGNYYVKASSECDFQWYDHRDSLEEGDLVHVTMPDEVSDIDFDLPTIYTRGDVNKDGVTDIGDVIYLVNYLYKNGCAPYPIESGDANCDAIADVGDVIYLINYLFKGGQAPSC
ncbi:MAG TPA: carboxypeptidase regulatory-like domain-containing protein [candidate division Zixibacteria bacterium]